MIIDSEGSGCEFARVLHLDRLDAVSVHALGGGG